MTVTVPIDHVGRPLNDAARPVFDRLVDQGTLRDIPWYLFHFAVTKPLAMYSQAPLARLFGRPENADDHALMSATGRLAEDLEAFALSSRGSVVRDR